MDAYTKSLMEDSRAVLERAKQSGRPLESHWEEGGVKYEGQRLFLEGFTEDQKFVRLRIQNVLSLDGKNMQNGYLPGLTVEGKVSSNEFSGEFTAFEGRTPTQFSFNGTNGAFRASEAFLRAEVNRMAGKRAS